MGIKKFLKVLRKEEAIAFSKVIAELKLETRRKKVITTALDEVTAELDKHLINFV